MADILIIEPDRLLADIYTKSLTTAGHRTWVCGSAQQAIHLLDKQKTDLIVLELQLVDHGGIEFLYELKSYPEWQSLPIIVHTFVPEYLFSDNGQQIEKLGIIQYLYKPATTLRHLTRAVTAALEPVPVEPLRA